MSAVDRTLQCHKTSNQSKKRYTVTNLVVTQRCIYRTHHSIIRSDFTIKTKRQNSAQSLKGFNNLTVEKITLLRNCSSRNYASLLLTTVFFIRSVSTVVLPVTHKLISNTLPVGALELSGVTAIGGHYACQFIRSVTAMIDAVTHLPFGDAHAACAAKLCVKTAVGR